MVLSVSKGECLSGQQKPHAPHGAPGRTLTLAAHSFFLLLSAQTTAPIRLFPWTRAACRASCAVETTPRGSGRGAGEYTKRLGGGPHNDTGGREPHNEEKARKCIGGGETSERPSGLVPLDSTPLASFASSLSENMLGKRKGGTGGGGILLRLSRFVCVCVCNCVSVTTHITAAT